jgi:membrane protein DedA with SNARE-associated domain
MTLNPADWPGGLAYGAIFLAALIEGEVVFVAAAALVGQGSLHAVGVMIAGGLGASAGDQLAFYLVRHRIRSWLDRVAPLQRMGRALEHAVQRHAGWLAMAVRFAPGLRLTIIAACAYSSVSPWLFSICNLIGAAAWAVSLMALVAWLGPAWMSRLGLHGWWGVAVPAAVIAGADTTATRSRRQPSCFVSVAVTVRLPKDPSIVV